MTVPAVPAELVAVLRFHAAHENAGSGALIDAVRTAFGLSLPRYYQRLALAVAHPGAEAVEPGAVRRARTQLERTRRRRTVRGARP